MNIYKFIRLFNTVKYLKFKQIFYRLFYYIKTHIRQWNGSNYQLDYDIKSTRLSFFSFIPSVNLYSKKTFMFLNLSHKFDSEIDWNFSDFGKLWTYNLNYFEYLNQDELLQNDGLNLMLDFIEQVSTTNDGLEPYPISLRGINWIKFLTKYQINNDEIDDSLYAQYHILLDNLEYHLLGNHLLENGFSLLFGAYYFKDDKLYKKAKEILTEELNEQILGDGAHFELSPMYHQIMLYRILDCINLVQNNDWKKRELIRFFTAKAEIMLGWLDIITFKNGNIPLLNDSAKHIAPTTKELNKYANQLNLKIKKLVLCDSGYRKIEKRNYEMIVDVGNIGPDYIPGHAHSDTFNFELYIQGKPFIVDTGLSTYEANKRRTLERSTFSHNTVEVGGIEQSEVWGAFRVASRAKITDLLEKENYISAVHNGYKKRLDTMHKREFLFEDDTIKLIDTIYSKNAYKAIARLHFYPGVSVKKQGRHIVCDSIKLYSSSDNIIISEYEYASEFNKTIPAQMIEINFNKRLELEIEI